MPALWKEALRKSLHTIERPFDATKRRFKRRFNLYQPIEIQPYRGYGNRREQRILGRVLENRITRSPTDDDPWWQNAAAMIRRFRTDEIAFCKLKATMFGETQQAETDSEGYFDIRFESAPPEQPDNSWHEVTFEVCDSITGEDDVTACGDVLIPPGDAQLGVVSDIDDTILKSSASNLFQLVRISMMNNARTRPAVPGAAAFYRALERGDASSEAANPFFYVSSSAWNVYDLLEEFMDFHHFPKGPILLRDLGIDSMKLLKSGHDHKLERIREIMGCYPSLPFLLIGDSGQQDAWLYRDACREFPGRVAAVYVHDVKASRREDVEKIGREIEAEGVPMLLFESALTAAEHAAKQGFIREDSLDDVADCV